MRPRQLMKSAPRWALTMAYAAVIFYLSSRHWNGIPNIPYVDKVAHLGLYGGLGALVCWSLSECSELRGWRLVAAAVVAAILYGASDEFHQMFVPGRSAELGDLIADGMGGLIGASLAMWALSRSLRPEEKGGAPS